MKKLLALLMALFLLAPAAVAEEAPVLLFIGQDNESISAYAGVFGTPDGITTYTSLPSLDGLFKAADWGAGMIDAQAYIDDPAYVKVPMAIGLYIVEQTANIGRGLCRSAIGRLGEFIKSAGRDVYLRIGYEFNGAWNGYEPESYIAAFREIMDSLRAQGVDNVYSVWQSSGFGAKGDLMRWYPGDEYVDYVGYSYFDGNPLLIGSGILQIARERGKKVFICEAAPKRDNAKSDGDMLWQDWYEPFLKHIEKNRDVMFAVSYINSDWESQRMWRGQGWGDSRVQANEMLAARWREALSSGLFAKKEAVCTGILFEDDFSGDALDLSKWSAREGNWLLNADGAPVVPGWGNDEMQYYTGEHGNLYVADGCLHIRARKETSPVQQGKAYPYTSARIDTREKFSFTYGKITVRAKLPAGAGLWPAIWLMPEKDVYGAWAASGEIDIMEARGRLTGEVSGALHFGGVSPQNAYTTKKYYFADGKTTDTFHEYSLIWREKEITWLVDGEPYHTARLWRTPAAPYPAPFDQPFYIILNLAVGGSYDAVQTDDAALPAEMLVDYVRVEVDR